MDELNYWQCDCPFRFAHSAAEECCVVCGSHIEPYRMLTDEQYRIIVTGELSDELLFYDVIGVEAPYTGLY